MNPEMTVAAVFAVFAAAAAVLILLERSRQNRQLHDKIKNSWGSPLSQLFSVREPEEIRVWSDSGRGSPERDRCAAMDDITAKDLDLDRVFRLMDHTLSSPGSEVLYAWLRHPLTDPEALKERIRAEDYFEAHEAERNRIREILLRTGRLKKGSFAASILALEEAEPIGRSSYLILSVLTAALFVLLFVSPLAAVIGMVPVLFLDFRTHLAMKERTAPCIAGFRAVLRLLEASDRILALDIPELRPYTKGLAEASKAFSGFRKGAFLITSAGSVGTGIGDAVLEYIKMFFHVDLIRFDAMLAAVRGHIGEACLLLDRIGSLDALAAAASFGKSAGCVCRPSFAAEEGGAAEAAASGNSGAGAGFAAEALVHPLLTDPVPNSISVKQDVLLTGSNASGKSTFLRSAALAAVMAQSVGLVTAASYRAPMYRIITSMALEDSLENGESYYAVEIRSLKRICDAAALPGPPVLAVIDEVLKGTNTTERIAASSQILKALAGGNAMIIAATHDGELTEMLKGLYRNMHFGETVTGGDVSFDYILRDGASEGRNAIRLLAEAGYGAEITDGARRCAREFEETGEWRL